jgi:hypothetical protein
VPVEKKVARPSRLNRQASCRTGTPQSPKKFVKDKIPQFCGFSWLAGAFQAGNGILLKRFASSLNRFALKQYCFAKNRAFGIGPSHRFIFFGKRQIPVVAQFDRSADGLRPQHV